VSYVQKIDSPESVVRAIDEVGLRVAEEIIQNLECPQPKGQGGVNRLVETLRTHVVLRAFAALEGMILDRLGLEEQDALRKANDADLARMRMMDSELRERARAQQVVH